MSSLTIIGSNSPLCVFTVLGEIRHDKYFTNFSDLTLINTAKSAEVNI